MTDAVVLVTDYGVDDTYAAALVGACWRVDASLRVVSGTHGVPPGDVLAGAYHLKAAAAAFAPGSVLCGVVDPGVGTDRRIVALDTGWARCVAPDNGLASYLWAESDPSLRRCVSITPGADATATFHGRDVIAPAAARLAAGAPLDGMGDALTAPELLGEAFAVRSGDELIARVAAVDHFGNAITSARACDLDGAQPAGAGWSSDATLTVVRTYAEIARGDLAVLMGSAGHLEIAARDRPAAALGGPVAGETVRILLG